MDPEKSIPFAESAVDPEQGGEIQPESKNCCLNCNTPLTGVYCPECGQKNIPKRQTLGDLFTNFISSFWSYESKFFLTGQFLLFNPGKLAKDYNEGKRERYYHPARMYVFISFVFFMILALLPDNKKSGIVNFSNTSEGNQQLSNAELKKLSKRLTEYDSMQKALPEEKKDSALKYQAKKKLILLAERYTGEPEDFQKEFVAGYINNIPKVLFFLLPLFALLLNALYYRRDFFYSEHLVFSIYFYNFTFLAGSIYMLIELIPQGGYVSWMIIMWILVYLLFGMKRMYLQSWKKTIFKYCTFLFFFSFLILAGLAVNLALTLIAL